MNDEMMWRRIQKTVYWLLLAVTVVFLVSGFGITEFRIVETATFGLLTKALAFKMHEVIWIPFVILLVLHLALGFWGQRARRNMR